MISDDLISLGIAEVAPVEFIMPAMVKGLILTVPFLVETRGLFQLSVAL